MPPTLDYARPERLGPRLRLLDVWAWIFLLCPLLLVASLDGQWLLSWAVLGHIPRPSLDDPKYIDGASGCIQ
jgi:hypothetical protein